jgi:hypothetical protein
MKAQGGVMRAFALSLEFFTLVAFSAMLLLVASGCNQAPPPAPDQASVPNPQAAPPPPPLPSGTATASPQPANYSTASRIRQLNFNAIGQVDGFLLDNGVQVPFPPSFSGTVPPLRTRVWVSGFLHPTDANGRTIVDAQLIVERPGARQLGAVSSAAAPPPPRPDAPTAYVPPTPPPGQDLGLAPPPSPPPPGAPAAYAPPPPPPPPPPPGRYAAPPSPPPPLPGGPPAPPSGWASSAASAVTVEHSNMQRNQAWKDTVVNLEICRLTNRMMLTLAGAAGAIALTGCRPPVPPPPPPQQYAPTQACPCPPPPPPPGRYAAPPPPPPPPAPGGNAPPPPPQLQ